MQIVDQEKDVWAMGGVGAHPTNPDILIGKKQLEQDVCFTNLHLQKQTCRQLLN